MKTRSGFVSNSSSSSFIVGFPRDNLPESSDEMCSILFTPEQEFFGHPYSDCVYPVYQIAETVYKDYVDFNNQSKEKQEEEIIQQLSNVVDREENLYNKLNYEDYKKFDWDAHALYCRRKAFDRYEDILKKKLKLVLFSYGDENGEYYCALEHGDLFDRMFHIQISNH